MDCWWYHFDPVGLISTTIEQITMNKIKMHFPNVNKIFNMYNTFIFLKWNYFILPCIKIMVTSFFKKFIRQPLPLKDSRLSSVTPKIKGFKKVPAFDNVYILCLMGIVRCWCCSVEMCWIVVGNKLHLFEDLLIQQNHTGSFVHWTSAINDTIASIVQTCVDFNPWSLIVT